MSKRSQLSERFNLWSFVTLLAWRGGLEWWWLVALFIQCGFALVALVGEVFFKLEENRCACGAVRSLAGSVPLRARVAMTGNRILTLKVAGSREEPTELRACMCGAVHVRREE